MKVYPFTRPSVTLQGQMNQYQIQYVHTVSYLSLSLSLLSRLFDYDNLENLIKLNIHTSWLNAALKYSKEDLECSICHNVNHCKRIRHVIHSKMRKKSMFCLFIKRISLRLALYQLRIRIMYLLSSHFSNYYRERSGSVVECLTRDQRAVGSSLTRITQYCPWARYINPCLVLGPSWHNWKIVDWDVKNQIRQTNFSTCVIRYFLEYGDSFFLENLFMRDLKISAT